MTNTEYGFQTINTAVQSIKLIFQKIKFLFQKIKFYRPKNQVLAGTQWKFCFTPAYLWPKRAGLNPACTTNRTEYLYFNYSALFNTVFPGFLRGDYIYIIAGISKLFWGKYQLSLSWNKSTLCVNTDKICM